MRFGKILGKITVKIILRILDLANWKMMLIATAASGVVSFSFLLGVRWAEHEQLEEARATIVAIETQAVRSLDTLNSLWEVEASRAKIEVEKWERQNSIDETLIQELLIGQSEIRSKFDEINQQITITTSLGECTFTPDAVRMLRDASEATDAATTSSTANSQSGPGDSG